MADYNSDRDVEDLLDPPKKRQRRHTFKNFAQRVAEVLTYDLCTPLPCGSNIQYATFLESGHSCVCCQLMVSPLSMLLGSFSSCSLFTLLSVSVPYWAWPRNRALFAIRLFYLLEICIVSQPDL